MVASSTDKPDQLRIATTELLKHSPHHYCLLKSSSLTPRYDQGHCALEGILQNFLCLPQMLELAVASNYIQVKLRPEPNLHEL